MKPEICYDDGVVKLIDVSRKYLNVIAGERVTVAQPSNYKKTIYFFGPCIMRGSRVEDKYTIESFLQKKLNAIGEYRVVNCGTVDDVNIEINGLLGTNFNKGDIAVIYSYNDCFSGVPDLNIWEIAEKYEIPVEWCTDKLIHCNHRVNQLVAEEIFSMLQPELVVDGKKSCEPVKLDKKEYIIKSYINKYFSDFDYTNYDKIGAG